MNLSQLTPAVPSSSAPRRQPLSRSALSWSLVEAGRTSFIVLVSIYVFVPYLAAVLVGDPIRGQQLVADLSLWAGIGAGLSAPLLGVCVDHLGPRKPLLLAMSLCCVPLTAALWWARPGGIDVTGVALILSSLSILFVLCEVLQNAMLVHAAAPDERAHASGLAYAFGNGVSTLLLLFVLWAFVLPGTVPGNWLPQSPLLGLDRAAHEPERLVGPLVAAVLALTVLPLLFFSRDAPPTGLPLRHVVARGGHDLKKLLSTANEAPQARTFLIARMIFADAQGGVILFTGVYAAGVLGWGPMELMVEGILASIFATLGGMLAGPMDHRLGAKRSLMLSLGFTLLAILGEIAITRDRVAFWITDPAVVGRPWSGPIFNTWSEWAFIGCDLLVSVFVVCAFASSRTLLAQLAPPERIGAFYGLFALSGRATAWLCPLLIGIATVGFGSQQMGYLPIAFMMVTGMLLLWLVRVPQARGAAPQS